MITLTALAIALALGWAIRTLWKAFVRATTPPPVRAVAIEGRALTR